MGIQLEVQTTNWCSIVDVVGVLHEEFLLGMFASYICRVVAAFDVAKGDDSLFNVVSNKLFLNVDVLGSRTDGVVAH